MYHVFHKTSRFGLAGPSSACEHYTGTKKNLVLFTEHKAIYQTIKLLDYTLRSQHNASRCVCCLIIKANDCFDEIVQTTKHEACGYCEEQNYKDFF
jgi:hypothetical protein